jgi:pimeloyl-ACP methyl ester carboxylesterase
MSPLPVVALHGQPGAPWVFAPVAARLRARGIAVDVPDRPGYGSSELAPTGVDGNSGWLRELIAALPGQRAVVVAHSWAALPALHAASEAPEAVAALVLLSPAGPTAVTATDRLIARRALGPVITWPLAVPASGQFDWLARPWLRVAVPRPDRQIARNALRDSPARGVMRSFLVEQRAMIDELQVVSDAVRRIEVPCVVVIGTADALIAPRSMLQLARSLPRCEVELLHGSGHSVQLHRPAEVAAIVERQAFAQESPAASNAPP